MIKRNVILIFTFLFGLTPAIAEIFSGESVQSKSFWEMPLRFWFSDGSPVDSSAKVLAYPVISDTSNHAVEPIAKFQAIQKIGGSADTFGVFVFAPDTAWVYQFTVDDTLQAYPKNVAMGNAKAIIDSSAYASSVFGSDVIPAHALGDSIVLSNNIGTGEVKTKNVGSVSITGPKLGTGAVSAASKVASSIMGPTQTDLTADFPWTGQHSFSDTIWVSGPVSWRTNTIYKHPDAVVSSTTGIPTLEFWDYVPGSNAYGGYVQATGGAVTRIMAPWVPDGAAFERLVRVADNVNCDSLLYVDIYFALLNTALDDSVSAVIECLFYTPSVEGAGGDVVQTTLNSDFVQDPTTFTILDVSHYDYTTVKMSGAYIDLASYGVSPGDIMDLRLTFDLGAGDNPIALLEITAKTPIRWIYPN